MIFQKFPDILSSRLIYRNPFRSNYYWGPQETCSFLSFAASATMLSSFYLVSVSHRHFTKHLAYNSKRDTTFACFEAVGCPLIVIHL